MITGGRRAFACRPQTVLHGRLGERPQISDEWPFRWISNHLFDRRAAYMTRRRFDCSPNNQKDKATATTTPINRATPFSAASPTDSWLRKRPRKELSLAPQCRLLSLRGLWTTLQHRAANIGFRLFFWQTQLLDEVKCQCLDFRDAFVIRLLQLLSTAV